MRLFKRVDIRRAMFRKTGIIVIAVILSVCSGVYAFNQIKKEIVISDAGIMPISAAITPVSEQVLKKCGSDINPDNIKADVASSLRDDNEGVPSIKAVSAIVHADGKEFVVNTYKKTVGDMLSTNNIYLDANDRLEGALIDDEIIDNMVIKVVRVEEKIVNVRSAISYETVKRANNHLDEDVEKVIKSGEEGLLEKSYKVIYEDGVQIAREFIGDTILKEPINKVIEYGTIASYNTARGGTIRYTEVIYDMKCTAYTASYEDTGKRPGDPYFGITASGEVARRGIIAVDPKVIPLGTRVYVEVRGKTHDYGFALCADTGGAIKGNIIDIYLDEQQEVYNWGVKKVNVYILAD